MKISTNTTAWLAGFNTFVSAYILWTYYRAMQYTPGTAHIPFELTGTQFGLLFFECVSVAVSAYFLFDKNNDAVKRTVLVFCALQLLAMFLTPFLIAAVLWPRVL